MQIDAYYSAGLIQYIMQLTEELLLISTTLAQTLAGRNVSQKITQTWLFFSR